jgi:predicted metalloprotease
MVGGGLGGVVLVLVALFFGVDPTVLLNQASPLPTGPPARTAPASSPSPDDRLADFVRVVLAETEDTWREIFRQAGRTYEEPRLVLFSGSVSSACGFAQAARGPFYRPADRKVYLQMQTRGYVVPDAFTHGTSAQRVQWFRRGIETGNLKNCNTFATARQ